MLSTMYESVPPEPSNTTLAADLKKAGLAMTTGQLYAKRNDLTRLVATGLRRPRVRAGQAQKGNYLFVNYMRSTTPLSGRSSRTMSRVRWPRNGSKEGAMTAWVFSTVMLPGGSDVCGKEQFGQLPALPRWNSVMRYRSSVRPYLVVLVVLCQPTGADTLAQRGDYLA